MSRHLKLSFVLITILFFSASAANAGSWTQGSVTSAAGTRAYKLWIPDSYNNKTPAPLVLMLHGCTQNPDDFAAGTRMNSVADANNFLVLYPEQPASANGARCWNWFEPAHQARGAGEPSLIAAVVNDVRTTHKVDDLRIYAAGMSAGAAMAVTMATAYPEIFSAIAVCAGLEYKAANNVATAFAAQASGGADPNIQGEQAYQAIIATPAKVGRRAFTSTVRRRLVRVIVFHGTLDLTVRSVNGDQVIAQWAQTDDLLDDGRDNDTVRNTPASTTNGTVPNGYNFTRDIYTDATGKILLEKWLVQDMRHAWSGGSTAGTYTDPKGPDASTEIWRFFRETSRTPPIINSGRIR